VGRLLSGDLTEDEFKPLRLMNGVYLQLHAYMLRIAIPYGTLSSRQMRKLAHIARTYDRGTGHFTTRQNLQFNWPKLSDIPDILDELASVEMHAIQTSGNCIRNVTADHFAGAAADEVADPRPYAEIIRQWSSLHPEFSFLPRKFKVAVTAAEHDRAAAQVEEEWQRIREGALKLPEAEIRRIEAYFAPPAFERRPAKASLRPAERGFERWVTRNTHTHKQPGYALVTISLKPVGGIPGDASADQMESIADLAERYSFDEVRVTHEQNLVLPHVRIED